MTNYLKTLEKIVIPLIVGVLAVIGSIMVSILTPGSFLVHPTFIIEPEEFSVTDSIKTQIFKVTNIGWVQAKNVQIDVTDFFNESKIVGSICPEAYIESTQNYTQHTKIKLERLSVNLPCSIGLHSKTESPIYDVVVTADNSPATQFFGKTGKTETSSDPFDEIGLILTLFMGIVSGLIAEFIQRLKRKKSQ